ncbi:MAG TPA: PhnD/SsuA/transferrin family substrate-binding protein [Phototrophicaceae bacterium]|nr:PhnD/SsuA/transferrin family substrate-binding protein [Phototrophicaceae bacterium]
MKWFRVGWLALLLLVLVVGLPVGAQSPEKLEHLVLAGPPGPLSIPLAYLVANDKLAEIADDVELVLWEDQNQLRAMIAGGQADLVTMPANNAAIFYNNGLDVQLLDIAAWNASFGISADKSITSLADAVGKRVVIPFEGSIPDLLFQYIATANDLNPAEDFKIQYTPNPQQAAQMIIGGQADVAILPEPLATAVLLKTKDAAEPLLRAFSLSDEWTTITDDVKTPLTGTVALPSVQDQPEVIAVFQREYALAIAWVIENPEAAGKLAEEQLPELGLTAKPVTLSLQQTAWEDVSAQDARADIESFFTLLLELSPDVVGGHLPDDDFYYGGE